MFKFLLATFLVYCSFGVASPLIVGTNAEFPPFTFREGREIVGFDIDVAKEIAKRLGKEIKFKDMPFDALIPDIVMGHVDFVAAGMSYTEERAKRVLFTKPYLAEDPFVILTLASKGVANVNELSGKTVVVNEGFTADLYLSEKPGIKLVRLPATADAFLALTSGRSDAFVTAKSTVDVFMKTQDPAKFHVTAIAGTGETCALVVSKKTPQMLADIQNALDAMESDGTMAQLKSKWNLR